MKKHEHVVHKWKEKNESRETDQKKNDSKGKEIYRKKGTVLEIAIMEVSIKYFLLI